ncbi:lactadherin-like [Patiria miniata]|uniref:F5/8 type C domain-containing protein n=1 Tax=Patiria miniata TaxID=46514 RepID=A0A914AAY6_PATMI|nr:lactadherin-like [Patiria miniata]
MTRCRRREGRLEVGLGMGMMGISILVDVPRYTLMGVVSAERVCYFSQEPDARHPGRLRWFMPGSKEDHCACTSTRPGPVYMQPVRWSHPPFYTDTPIFTNDQEDIHDYFNCHVPPTDDLKCSKGGPFGMEDGRIPDASITASSMWQNKTNHGPTRARLNLQAGSASAWCNTGASETHPWIQVDLGSNVIITGVITQGRWDGNYLDWVTEFEVAYSDDGQEWTDVTDDESSTPMKFPGNFDKNTHVTTTFPKALQARFLRILPTQWERHCCMRFEVLGCTINE